MYSPNFDGIRRANKCLRLTPGPLTLATGYAGLPLSDMYIYMKYTNRQEISTGAPGPFEPANTVGLPRSTVLPRAVTAPCTATL